MTENNEAMSLEPETIERITNYLYTHDHELGFCGHDLDGEAMSNIIRAVAEQLGYSDCEHEFPIHPKFGTLFCELCGVEPYTMVSCPECDHRQKSIYSPCLTIPIPSGKKQHCKNCNVIFDPKA